VRLAGFVCERDGALDDGCVLREREADLGVTPCCLEDAGGRRSVVVIYPPGELRVAGDDGAAQALRRAEVNQSDSGISARAL
jgi:hypothetical protein